MRAARECGAIPELPFNVRPIASASVLGSFERRSAVRKNRRLARAEVNMAAEVKKEIQLEIAHLLFIDVVGYSKLLVNEQIELMQELNRIVRGTECFREAEASGQLIRLQTGDGMA